MLQIFWIIEGNYDLLSTPRETPIQSFAFVAII
jgi:hypothetical protein